MQLQTVPEARFRSTTIDHDKLVVRVTITTFHFQEAHIHFVIRKIYISCSNERRVTSSYINYGKSCSLLTFDIVRQSSCTERPPTIHTKAELLSRLVPKLTVPFINNCVSPAARHVPLLFTYNKKQPGGYYVTANAFWANAWNEANCVCWVDFGLLGCDAV
jgi:hypothetical protein